MTAIRRTANRVPRYGLALHGTPIENIRSINASGITTEHKPGSLLVHFVTLGPRIKTASLLEREILRRAFKAATIAAGYGCKQYAPHHNTPESNFPAVVILKGTKEQPFLAGKNYEEDEDPFGIAYYHRISPKQIAKIVTLTAAEHEKLLIKAGVAKETDNGQRQKSSEDTRRAVIGQISKFLAMKTLREIRQMLKPKSKK